jgi:hypothetical protein
MRHLNVCYFGFFRRIIKVSGRSIPQRPFRSSRGWIIGERERGREAFVKSPLLTTAVSGRASGSGRVGSDLTCRRTSDQHVSTVWFTSSKEWAYERYCSPGMSRLISFFQAISDEAGPRVRSDSSL